MDRFQALRVFSQVVEAGSFSGAAEKLGLSTTAASRHVAELEAHLQTRLLNRTTRRVSLTESGRTFYERAVQLLADLAEAEQEVSRASVVPRGTVRLTRRVVRFSRRVWRCASSSATCRDAAVVESPSFSAAPEKLPASTTCENTRSAWKRSMGPTLQRFSE